MIFRASIDPASLAAGIEECLAKKALLDLKVAKRGRLKIYPHRLVYLGGRLTLIGERITDKSLTLLPLGDIRKFCVNTKSAYQNNFSPKEVDDLINATRAVSGNEERLVLKLKSFEKVNLTPPFHFWGNPYVVSNFDGSLIWGASVELSEQLMDWLAEIHSEVDILEPTYIRDTLEERLL